MLRFLEAELLSPRVAASVIEIDRTLSTWPQLSGDVVLGATTVTEAVRRIGLAEDLQSGRVRVDVSSALDQLEEPEPAAERPPPPADYSEPVQAGTSGVIVAAAIRAPSAGNAQPWHVEVGADVVTIRLAPEHTSTIDVGLRGSAVALGAALFNARVAAASQRALGPATLLENVDGAPLQATLQLRDGVDPDLAGLCQPMLARETNRRLGTSCPIAAGIIELLRTVAEREGAQLNLLTARNDIERAAMILAAAERARYLTPQLHAEMVSELRWPGVPGQDTGIDVRSLELAPGDLAVLDILRRPDVMAYLAQWNGGTALGEDTRQRIVASSAVAVILVPGGTLTDYARGGSAAEAVWITAQQHGLAVQPISPLFLYARDVKDLTELSSAFADELRDLQKEFQQLVQIPAAASLALVLRFAVGDPASVRSRRNLDRICR
jgi:hypothetical protein